MENIQMMIPKDRLLLSYLRADSRLPLTRLSRLTHIPVTSIFERLRRYRGKVVRKFTALLDFQQLGLPIWASVNIKVDRKDREAVKEYLFKRPEVNSLYKINNGYDFLFDAVFPSVRDAEEFLEALELKHRVLEIHTSFIIDELKREAFLASHAVALDAPNSVAAKPS